MGRSLESYGRTSLEQKRREKIERYGSRSLDAVEEADFEKDGLKDHSQTQNEEEELDTYSALYTLEELAERRRVREIEEQEKKIREMALESEEPEYDAETLWDATKDVPVQDTLDAAEQDKNMETQYKGFREVAESADLSNAEMEKRLAEERAELEGIF